MSGLYFIPSKQHGSTHTRSFVHHTFVLTLYCNICQFAHFLVFSKLVIRVNRSSIFFLSSFFTVHCESPLHKFSSASFSSTKISDQFLITYGMFLILNCQSISNPSYHSLSHTCGLLLSDRLGPIQTAPVHKLKIYGLLVIHLFQSRYGVSHNTHVGSIPSNDHVTIQPQCICNVKILVQLSKLIPFT